jgi:ABC-type multidrug transport system ATPase subunit
MANIIEIENLTKYYEKGSVKALNGINLDFVIYKLVMISTHKRNSFFINFMQISKS